MKEDSMTYQIGNDQIIVSGGRTNHRWTQLRGAFSKIEGKSVYLTRYTPFNHQLIIMKNGIS